MRLHSAIFDQILKLSNLYFLFRYLINEPNYCLKNDGDGGIEEGQDDVDILILVSSAISHSERREAIRDTWGSKEHLSSYNTKVLFLLGQGNDHQGKILEESQERHDIIQEDFHVRIFHNSICDK